MDTDLSIKLIFKLLNFPQNEDIEIPLEDFELTIINLNSIFSTTFYENMINEFLVDESKMTEYVEAISEIFKMVLTFLTGKKIIMLYSTKISDFTNIYEKWRNERHENKEKNEFAKVIFTHFINIFDKLHEASPLIEITNTDIFDPVIYPHAFIRIREYNKNIFLVSRDRLDFLNLINPNIIMYDGQQLYTKETFSDHGVKKIPKIDIEFLKYYYLLRGIKKYNYPGIRGMGRKRSIKYIDQNLSELVDGKDQYINKNIRLFDFDEYINNLKKDKYKKLLNIINGSKF